MSSNIEFNPYRIYSRQMDIHLVYEKANVKFSIKQFPNPTND